MIAVLAGDIIKSSRLTPEELQNVKDCIVETCDELREKFPEIGLSKPFFYRGDGWQVAMKSAPAALKVAVFIYAGLRQQNIARSRIAIGVGETEKLDLENLDQSSGEAFERAGHCLDKMNTRSFDIDFATAENSEYLNVKDDGLFALTMCVAALISDWTARQAQIALVALFHIDQTNDDVAKLLNPPISQQAISDSLRSSKFFAVIGAITAFSNILS
ncbi:hypothetical protein [Hirschia baltica]|uniref:Uncharacterized protein n=1 Tax=Hirschia baltica (strain ATCC 49814 / DSM 5838 / IFAM 1418) TaxID=582402 RepID=C6XIA6_HIRBI|nr:hypothetical protein [Hirschia baltica]ACT58932.1 hypothetical protein Hbal_1240 [Hirschia baltica ATCC 49814]